MGFNSAFKRLTTGIRSEKWVVRRLRRCEKVIECTYINLDSTAYCTPRYSLLLLDYKPVQHLTILDAVGNCNTVVSIVILYYNITIFIGFGGLEVARWPLVPKGGFKSGRSRRIFKGEKIISTPSLGGEVKPSVPCRGIAACKRYLELRGSRILDEICWNISHPRRVPPSAARGLSRRWT